MGTRSTAAAAAEQLAAGGEPADRLEVLHGGEDEIELARLGPGQGVVGPDPHGVHRLVVVVDGHLARRHRGHEEAGVVALGRGLGRDPVAEVVDAVGGQAQPLAATGVEEAHLPGVERHPHGGQPVPGLGVVGLEDGVVVVGPVAAVGEQDARLLETLPEGRHPEGQTPGHDAQHGAGLGVAAQRAGLLGGGRPVLVVDLSPRKDIGAPDEVGVQVALEHAHLEGGCPLGRRRRAPA